MKKTFVRIVGIAVLGIVIAFTGCPVSVDKTIEKEGGSLPGLTWDEPPSISGDWD